MLATIYVYAILFLQSTTTGSNWDLRSMWSQMSALPRTVVVILFILSIYSFGVMIDRALMYSAARKQSRVFVQQVAGALKDGKLDEAIAIAERNKKSHIAKVVATGLSEFQSASQQVSDADVIEAAKRGLERSVAIVCGPTTISPIRWKPSTSRWTTPPWSSSIISSCVAAPESRYAWLRQ